jgi:hypothetical protein
MLMEGLILLSVALQEREAFYHHVTAQKQKGKTLSATEMKRGRIVNHHGIVRGKDKVSAHTLLCVTFTFLGVL